MPPRNGTTGVRDALLGQGGQDGPLQGGRRTTRALAVPSAASSPVPIETSALCFLLPPSAPPRPWGCFGIPRPHAGQHLPPSDGSGCAKQRHGGAELLGVTSVTINSWVLAGTDRHSRPSRTFTSRFRRGWVPRLLNTQVSLLGSFNVLDLNPALCPGSLSARLCLRT